MKNFILGFLVDILTILLILVLGNIACVVSKSSIITSSLMWVIIYLTLDLHTYLSNKISNPNNIFY